MSLSEGRLTDDVWPLNAFQLSSALTWLSWGCWGSGCVDMKVDEEAWCGCWFLKANADLCDEWDADRLGADEISCAEGVIKLDFLTVKLVYWIKLKTQNGNTYRVISHVSFSSFWNSAKLCGFPAYSWSLKRHKSSTIFLFSSVDHSDSLRTSATTIGHAHTRVLFSFWPQTNCSFICLIPFLA